jgi:hypothetical protein
MSHVISVKKKTFYYFLNLKIFDMKHGKSTYIMVYKINVGNVRRLINYAMMCNLFQIFFEILLFCIGLSKNIVFVHK